MTGPVELLRGVFVRSVTDRPPDATHHQLPANVVPLRPAVRERPAPPVVATNADTHGLEPGTLSLAPVVGVAGLSGVPERWLACAIATAMRDRRAARCAFVVDSGFEGEDDGDARARLRLGAGSVTLPFAVRRHGSRLMAVGETAAERHCGFLRAIGPVVWSVGGTEDDRLALRRLAAEADAMLLARPAAVDAAYSSIVADGLRSASGAANVVQVLCGVASATDLNAADGEIVVPASALDRWRVQHGLGCAPATARAIAALVELL